MNMLYHRYVYASWIWEKIDNLKHKVAPHHSTDDDLPPSYVICTTKQTKQLCIPSKLPPNYYGSIDVQSTIPEDYHQCTLLYCCIYHCLIVLLHTQRWIPSGILHIEKWRLTVGQSGLLYCKLWVMDFDLPQIQIVVAVAAAVEAP